MLLVSLLTQAFQGFERDDGQRVSDNRTQQWQDYAHEAIARQPIKIRYRHPDNLKQSHPFTGEISQKQAFCQVISDAQRE